MKQLPFDLDKYFLRFDRKCVLHNQDEKLVSCGLKNWEKIVKIGFTRESLSKSHFSKLLQVLLILKTCLKAKSLLESKILEFGFNPRTCLTLAQTFTLTLLRLISKAQMCK